MDQHQTFGRNHQGILKILGRTVSCYHILKKHFFLKINNKYLEKYPVFFIRSASPSIGSNGSNSHPATSTNTSIISSGFVFSYKAEVQHHQLHMFHKSGDNHHQNGSQSVSRSSSDEAKLREFISQLKRARVSVKSTIQPSRDLESMHQDATYDLGDNRPMTKVNTSDNQTADLEMAVLVQV